MCQGGVIWGGEGVELLGVYLGRTVAPVQFVLEIKAYFLYNGLPVGIAQCSQFYGRYKVFFCVGTQVSYGQLRACEYDWLAETGEHETQRRSRIGHRVGAVKDHESVICIVIVLYNGCYLCPVARVYVR